MKYVQPVGGAANDPYVDANPASGIEGSPVPAGAIEYPQRELDSLITDAGLTPSNADLTQVAKAIKTIFQKAAAMSAAATGTIDAIWANYSPAITALSDHLRLTVRAGGANTSTAPTFTPNAATVPAKTIVKGSNQPLAAGDIAGAGYRAEFQYDLTLDKWVLLNPATGNGASQPLDATLTALAAVVTAADKLIYATGADTFATTTLSAFIRTLLDDADQATARGTLGAAGLAVAQTYTAAQRGTVQAIAYSATITADFALANNGELTLTGNATLANPTNLVAGQSGIIKVNQDAIGSRTLAYGAYWKFPGGTAPVLTTTASAVDVIAYYVESATRITAQLLKDVK